VLRVWGVVGWWNGCSRVGLGRKKGLVGGSSGGGIRRRRGVRMRSVRYMFDVMTGTEHWVQGTDSGWKLE
jgi:hypothetical protein